jgi:atypical dual specificity phosphatase
MLVNFSWVVPGRVAGMGMPYGRAWRLLREEGVSAVLSLTEHAPSEDPGVVGLVTLHVPLVDFGTPSPDDLARCVAWIQEQTGAGRGVVVHCFAGVGRTGTVLAAWLTTQGRSAEEAIEEIRRLRPGSIETAGQAEAVRRFAAREGA